MTLQRLRTLPAPRTRIPCLLLLLLRGSLPCRRAGAGSALGPHLFALFAHTHVGETAFADGARRGWETGNAVPFLAAVAPLRRGPRGTGPFGTGGRGGGWTARHATRTRGIPCEGTGRGGTLGPRRSLPRRPPSPPRGRSAGPCALCPGGELCSLFYRRSSKAPDVTCFPESTRGAAPWGWGMGGWMGGGGVITEKASFTEKGRMRPIESRGDVRRVQNKRFLRACEDGQFAAVGPSCSHKGGGSSKRRTHTAKPKQRPGQPRPGVY